MTGDRMLLQTQQPRARRWNGNIWGDFSHRRSCQWFSEWRTTRTDWTSAPALAASIGPL